MNKVINRAICAVLILLNVQSELHSFLAKLFPEIKQMDVSGYIHNPPPYKVSLTWFIFLFEQNISTLGLLAIICIMACYLSFRIFVVATVYFAYHLIDNVALWYDYKQSHWFYWTMQICGMLGIWLICKPMREDKGCKVKQMF